MQVLEAISQLREHEASNSFVHAHAHRQTKLLELLLVGKLVCHVVDYLLIWRVFVLTVIVKCQLTEICQLQAKEEFFDFWVRRFVQCEGLDDVLVIQSAPNLDLSLNFSPLLAQASL